MEVSEATSYQLILRDPSGAEMVVDITPEDFMNGEFPSAFENLDPETDYEIVLRYTNAAGETQDAEPVTARTTGLSLINLHKLYKSRTIESGDSLLPPAPQLNEDNDDESPLYALCNMHYSETMQN